MKPLHAGLGTGTRIAGLIDPQSTKIAAATEFGDKVQLFANDGTQAEIITLRCTLEGLSPAELGAFAEYVTYKDGLGRLHVHWSARHVVASASTRKWVDISVRSGENGEGPSLDMGVRQLLASVCVRKGNRFR